MLAVTQGHFDVVKLLVEKNANVKVFDEDMHSPLHLALLRLSSASCRHGGQSGDNGSEVSIAAVAMVTQLVISIVKVSSPFSDGITL